MLTNGKIFPLQSKSDVVYCLMLHSECGIQGVEIMAYYLVRLYSGPGDRPIDEIMRAVGEEIAPKIKDAGGLQRYIAGITDDGQLISAAVCDSKAAAERGVEVSRPIAAQLDAVKHLQLSESFGGEIIRDDDGAAKGQHVTHGRGVIIQTSMPAEQVADILIQGRPDSMTNFQGRVRTLFVQLDDGRVLIAGGFTSKDARDGWARITREAALNSEAAKRVFGGNSTQEIDMTVHVHQA
jgi:hypothetical protein